MIASSRRRCAVVSATGASRYGAEDVPLFVFAKYDNDHTFLKSANWGNGSGLVIQLPKSRSEREHVTTTIVQTAGNRVETLTILARAR